MMRALPRSRHSPRGVSSIGAATCKCPGDTTPPGPAVTTAKRAREDYSTSLR